MKKIFLSINFFSKNSTKNFNKKFYLLIVLILINTIFEIVTIGSIIPFVGILINPESFFLSDFFLNLTFIDQVNIKKLQLIFFFLFITTVIISGIYKIFILYIIAKFNADIAESLANNIYKKLLLSNYIFFQKLQSFNLIDDIAVKVNQIVNGILYPIMNMFSSMFLVIGIICFFIFLFPLEMWVLISFFIFIYYLIFFFLKKKFLNFSSLIKFCQEKLIIITQNTIGYKREILLSRNFHYYMSAFIKFNKTLRNKQALNNFFTLSPRFLVETISIVIFSSIIFYLIGPENLETKIIFPIMASVVLAAQKLLPSAQNIFTGMSRTFGSYEILMSIYNFLNQNTILEKFKLEKKDFIFFRKEIEIRDLNFRFKGKKNRIFNNLNIKIFKGERIGIFSPSGKGKTTLMNILMGLYFDENNSHLYIDKIKINKFNLPFWQKKISYVPQDLFFPNESIVNIITKFTKKKIDYKKLQKVIKQTNLETFINSLPNKLNTKVGEKGIFLSGGQRQRLAIATALYKDCEIFIFDESTNSLDRNSEKEIIKIINNLKKECTVFFISHNRKNFSFCNRVINI